MDKYTLNLDKPRRLKYGFKALAIIEERYGGKKDLGDVMQGGSKEIPFLAWLGLTWNDESLTEEKVLDLLDDAIPDTYTTGGLIEIICDVITAQMGLKKKVKKTKKETASRTTVGKRSKSGSKRTKSSSP